MYELFIAVFLLGMVMSFYLNHKERVDKTKEKLEDLF